MQSIERVLKNISIHKRCPVIGLKNHTNLFSRQHRSHDVIWTVCTTNIVIRVSLSFMTVCNSKSMTKFVCDRAAEIEFPSFCGSSIGECFVEVHINTDL